MQISFSISQIRIVSSLLPKFKKKILELIININSLYKYLNYRLILIYEPDINFLLSDENFMLLTLFVCPFKVLTI